MTKLNAYRAFGVLGLTLATPMAALANDGLMFSGYSAKTLGMSGAGAAHPTDSQIGALNPAGFAFTGNRVDLTGVALSVDINSTVLGGDYSDDPIIAAPLPSVSYQFNDQWAFGLSTYGVGVMVDYGEPIPPAPGVTDTGATLMQLVLAPSVAYKLNEDHAIGASLLLAGQYFELSGLQAYGAPDEGDTGSFGVGFSIGYMGNLNEDFRVSASYFSQIHMGDLEGYENHLADETDVDLPARAILGLAYDVTPQLTLLADYNWIDWKSVTPLGNEFPGSFVLGAPDGPGAGWKEQHIVKIGAEYALNDHWTLRGGVSRSSLLWEKENNALNYLTPVTPRTHVALGASYKASENREWSFAWNRALSREQRGDGISTGTDLETRIDTFAVSYGWTF
ncbi:OmpP1/FadL family transporter [Celeribacter neptunius]|uniref:Long-chain fatty acid transport protein n=1 Tax=Celeribacter neptunius TaxID=588602 RepID=A0A1I3XX24_9RHOB|nr:outer membrane protein transport protein [Celeribacter neptunius]SFK24108.1 long-chain fatty acid transport protein [Celeribacter neptunius]